MNKKNNQKFLEYGNNRKYTENDLFRFSKMRGRGRARRREEYNPMNGAHRGNPSVGAQYDNTSIGSKRGNPSIRVCHVRRRGFVASYGNMGCKVFKRGV